VTALWADDPALIAEWVAARFPHVETFPPWARAVAWVDVSEDGTGEIVGGIVACPRGGGFDAELSIALETPRTTRAQWRTLCRLVFEEWGMARVTCHVAKSNRQSRRFCERLGFRREGALRRGYDGRQTAIIYGMTRDECRWL
jgi:hypothetical protein